MSPDKQNSGRHIDFIIGQTSCEQHEAPQGSACFEIRYTGREARSLPGVCGTRIRKAGFNGIIDPSSLSRSKARK